MIFESCLSIASSYVMSILIYKNSRDFFLRQTVVNTVLTCCKQKQHFGDISINLHMLWLSSMISFMFFVVYIYIYVNKRDPLADNQPKKYLTFRYVQIQAWTFLTDVFFFLDRRLKRLYHHYGIRFSAKKSNNLLTCVIGHFF